MHRMLLLELGYSGKNKTKSLPSESFDSSGKGEQWVCLQIDNVSQLELNTKYYDKNKSGMSSQPWRDTEET